MAPSGQPVRGLSAAELAAACDELQELVGARLLEAAPLAVPAGADDLLLVLQTTSPTTGKAFLLVAPGGPRARVSTTSRRFSAAAFARGPARDLLQKELAAATLLHVGATAGERRCALLFRTDHGDRRLVVELFGARGFWALLDAEGRCLVMSRVVETAVRTLRLHDPYVPPPAAAEPAAATTRRFPPPVLAAIDAFYRPLDELGESREDLDSLQRAAQRALHKTAAKVAGVSQQLADTGRAAQLRARADLMLAYAHTVRRGATSMRVPDPEHDGDELVIELDPSLPVVPQGQALYEKARRLDDGRAIAEQRLARAAAEHATLQAIVDGLSALTPDTTDLPAQLEPLRQQLRRLGALPKPPAASGPAKPAKAADDTRGENVRRFVSAEGYPIWVGRNNEQNDRLTMRLANGNDLWLHVGGGRAGSHVVIRLPKNKTASLESLLDAATLAVHFSKARGEHRIDVVYTPKKHVRKPKGLPAGAVVPAHTKTLTVHRDEARLARLLASSNDPAEP